MEMCGKKQNSSLSTNRTADSIPNGKVLQTKPRDSLIVQHCISSAALTGLKPTSDFYNISNQQLPKTTAGAALCVAKLTGCKLFWVQSCMKTAINMWRRFFFFSISLDMRHTSDQLNWKSMVLSQKIFLGHYRYVFSLQMIAEMDTERVKKNDFLFEVNLHGKHWADITCCPNHSGDSTQNKPYNLGQMWRQF